MKDLKQSESSALELGPRRNVVILLCSFYFLVFVAVSLLVTRPEIKAKLADPSGSASEYLPIVSVNILCLVLATVGSLVTLAEASVVINDEGIWKRGIIRKVFVGWDDITDVLMRTARGQIVVVEIKSTAGNIDINLLYYRNSTGILATIQEKLPHKGSPRS